ncbi:MAG: hypothetical protein EOO06_10290 [Chitinophagaceae bacterium]|nr:MAG: hypothetical protein EOO06_10290 [Chitinophagaceae bacterium]
MKKAFNFSCSLFFISSLLISCSASRQIDKQAQKLLFADSAIKNGHIGIAVYDARQGKYLYQHNAEKYFIPASNTKLFSWYAGMKYLGDSLVSARYLEYEGDLIVQPAGDPSFLNNDFPHQPLLKFLQTNGKSLLLRDGNFLDERWGKGWAWNDYPYYYMAEKSAMPLYGNIVKFYNVDDSANAGMDGNKTQYRALPKLFSKPEYWGSNKFKISNEIVSDFLQLKSSQPKTFFSVKKELDENKFHISLGYEKMKVQELPFTTSLRTTIDLLTDTLHKSIYPVNLYLTGHEQLDFNKQQKIFSQPTDSILKPMMHRSDNFFAEQTLLMVSNELTGYMSSEWIIDSLLKTELRGLPQAPRWVDGSGLSRYNLFTPQDFVWLLNKTRNEFSWDRITNILPTGGEGTLSNYYKDEKGFIYAKTGTLSNNCALSGYLITKKNRVLIFSVLVNNYPGGATQVRRAVEKFIKQLRNTY